MWHSFILEIKLKNNILPYEVSHLCLSFCLICLKLAPLIMVCFFCCCSVSAHSDITYLNFVVFCLLSRNEVTPLDTPVKKRPLKDFFKVVIVLCVFFSTSANKTIEVLSKLCHVMRCYIIFSKFSRNELCSITMFLVRTVLCTLLNWKYLTGWNDPSLGGHCSLSSPWPGPDWCWWCLILHSLKLPFRLPAHSALMILFTVNISYEVWCWYFWMHN